MFVAVHNIPAHRSTLRQWFTFGEEKRTEEEDKTMPHFYLFFKDFANVFLMGGNGLLGLVLRH